MAKPFGQLRATKNSPLAEYFSQCMDLTIEDVDHYRLKRIKRNDLFVRVSPSSLPVCPILASLDALQYRVQHKIFKEQGKVPIEEGDGGGATYMGLGSFRHTVAQEFLGRGKRILGNWVCKNHPECKRTYKFCTYRRCECGADTRYEEISVSVWRKIPGYPKKRKVASIKLDGLFIDNNGDLWVIDYKFCTSFRLIGKRTNLPDEKYKLQQRAYVAILRQIFKGKRIGRVKGFILLYVAFDEVGMRSTRGFFEYKEPISEESSTIYAERLEKQYELVTIANEIAKDTFVRYVLNSKAMTTEQAGQLIAKKPCKSLRHHREKMKPLHGCPMASTDMCFGPSGEFARILRQEARNILKRISNE